MIIVVCSKWYLVYPGLALFPGYSQIGAMENTSVATIWNLSWSGLERRLAQASTKQNLTELLAGVEALLYKMSWSFYTCHHHGPWVTPDVAGTTHQAATPNKTWQSYVATIEPLGIDIFDLPILVTTMQSRWSPDQSCPQTPPFSLGGRRGLGIAGVTPLTSPLHNSWSWRLELTEDVSPLNCLCAV